MGLGSMGVWDWLLLVAVPVHATFTAYVYQPKWKALLLTLPVPFTLATLAVAQPVNVTHMMGLILLLLFANMVRWLHCDFHLPIILSIALSALMYCVVGSELAKALPRTEWAFWSAGAVVLATGAALYVGMGHRDEPGHRSPLPVWIKFPIIAGVILGLVTIKALLQGFMAIFPMVGVITAYEARKSLWTVCRQIPVILLSLGPMMMAVHLAQKRIPTGIALALGWLVLLAILAPLTRAMWKKDERLLEDTSEVI